MGPPIIVPRAPTPFTPRRVPPVEGVARTATLAVVSSVSPTSKSASAASTVTVVWQRVVFPDASATVAVKVRVTLGDVVVEPDGIVIAPTLQLMEPEVAFSVSHESVDDWPRTMVEGLAFSSHEGPCVVGEERATKNIALLPSSSGSSPGQGMLRR